MGVNKTMNVCLDLHDWSPTHNRLEVLFKLRKVFPSFKVSLFTIPVDKSENWGPYLIRRDVIDIVKGLDWVQLIPHGLFHEGSEMRKCDYDTFKNTILPSIEGSFEADGLSYEKGFCAPHWLWTDGVVKALNEEGWWGAVDRDKVMPCPDKFYKYNFLLNERFWEESGDLKLHGHVYGTKNDVGRCFGSLLRLPRDVEWHFVTDFLENKE